jgi:hypothetical protein
MTTPVRYIGRFSAVEIEVAPGRWATVERNAVIEVADRIADGLLIQSSSWQDGAVPAAAATKPTRKKPARKKPPATAAARKAAQTQES